MFNLKTCISVALCSCLTAHAQTSYTDIVDTQRVCQQVGDAWREVFEKDTIFGMSMKQLADETKAGKFTQEQFNELAITLVSAQVKRRELRSGHDAYMAGWAECMDDAKRRHTQRRAFRPAQPAAPSVPASGQ